MNQHYYLNTPVFKSHLLAKEKGLNVFYKMDCYQPAGSFKIRGMERLCKYHYELGKRNFVASSGGNAGYSLAYVGMKLGVSVKVVVPKTTSQFMISKIENLGTEVEVFGNVWDEAHQYALQVAEALDAVYVSPFDDPLLWEGHSSLIDECAQQMDQPDSLVVSVGGGGLLCGILEGLKKNGWESTKVITTETLGAASFYKSWYVNELIELKEIKTVATSLGAKKVAKQALELSQGFTMHPFTMSDEEAIQATFRFLNEYNVRVEPACGAALSVPYFHPELIAEDKSTLVIVCGGANTEVKSIS